MSWGSSIIKGTNITAAKAGAAMMLLMARTEKNYAMYDGSGWHSTSTRQAGRVLRKQNSASGKKLRSWS
jgi:hypothetical protein